MSDHKEATDDSITQRRSQRLLTINRAATTQIIKDKASAGANPPVKKKQNRRKTIVCRQKFGSTNENFKVNFHPGMKTYNQRKSIQNSAVKNGPELRIPCENFKVNFYAGMKTYKRKSIQNLEATLEVIKSTMSTITSSRPAEFEIANYKSESKHDENIGLSESCLVKNADCNKTLNESNEILSTSESFLDNEAAETNSYVSGQSQDDEERLDMDANEIPVRGETITSDSEFFHSSSDYERDSFVVSSDPEDYQLLDTSSDLGSSDNELKMNKHSKQKYDMRKLKEQKAASREMFLARHGPKHPMKSSTSQNRLSQNNQAELSSSEIHDQNGCSNKDDLVHMCDNNLKHGKSEKSTENEQFHCPQTSNEVYDDGDPIKRTKRKNHSLQIDSSESNDTTYTSLKSKRRKRNAMRLDSDDNNDSKETTETSFTKKRRRRNVLGLDSDCQFVTDETCTDDVDHGLIDIKKFEEEGKNITNAENKQLHCPLTSNEFNEDRNSPVMQKKNTKRRIGMVQINPSDSDDSTNTDLMFQRRRRNQLLVRSSDLSSSDNELKINKHSKQQYDMLKLKEQKSESREMFLARHGPKHPMKTSTSQNRLSQKNQAELNSSEILDQNGCSHKDHLVHMCDNNLKHGKSEKSTENEQFHCPQTSSEVYDDVDPIKRTKRKNRSLQIDSSDSNDTTYTSLKSKRRKRNAMRLDSDDNNDSKETTETSFTKKRRRRNVMGLDSDCQFVTDETCTDDEDHGLIDIKKSEEEGKKIINVENKQLHCPLTSNEFNEDRNSPVMQKKKTKRRISMVQIDPSDSDITNTDLKIKRRRRNAVRLDSYLIDNDERSIGVVDQALIDNKIVSVETKDAASNNIASSNSNIVNQVSEDSQNTQDHNSDSAKTSIEMINSFPKGLKKASKKTKKSSYTTSKNEDSVLFVNNEASIDVVDHVLINNRKVRIETDKMTSKNLATSRSNVVNLVSEDSQDYNSDSSSSSIDIKIFYEKSGKTAFKKTKKSSNTTPKNDAT